MMIRLIVEDCHRPVNLLHENKSYHLVGEGHPAQGYFLGSRFIHSFAEPVRTSDDEDQPPRDTLHFLLHVAGELHRRKLFPFLVQQDQMVALLQRLQYQFALFLFLLAFRKILDILNVRNDLHFEREVMDQTVFIFIDGLHEVPGIRFPYGY